MALAILFVQSPVFAKNTSISPGGNDKQRYIVILDDPPLAAYDGRMLPASKRASDAIRLSATTNRFTGARKLDVNSPDSKTYLRFLDEKFASFRDESALRLGRPLRPTQRYRNALNGFATELSETEVRILRDVPGVSSVLPDEIQEMETDSGPYWLGADKIHDGSAGPFPATGGEGIVVALIDSGINWDHASFIDAGEGSAPGFDHVNPYPDQLGLCSKTEVLCNDKLVGVYDFVEDDTGTIAIEENTNGKDNVGHGSHVGSIAVGNPLNVTPYGIPTVIGGVAPNANLVSYRVCFIGDAADPDAGGCQTSAIFSAIDQAITDKVDVVNYSIGSKADDPWAEGSTAMAFLNLRAAGIFVATSAGNAGPNAGTIGSPANAPWIVAVGNATHDRVFASAVENLSGGDTPPPSILIGASFTDGIGDRKIVHAKDFGYPLCGIGEAQFGQDCASNTGLSNPFPPGTFSGEIVVCDRGEYGRVEKGKNLQLAGAGGYILANTDEFGEDIVANNHCLPATHLGLKNSDQLRTWLASGSNHQGALSGFSIFHITEAGDHLANSSSRGPGLPPIQNVLKPDVIAPGTEILGASHVNKNFTFRTGTSMASPHVTGGAALLKSVHPDWTPSMIASAIMMTATPELAIDYDGSETTPHKRGAGRPRLDLAVNAGLYLDESETGFTLANPDTGGDPKDLNLPGLVDTACFNTCSFQRSVTDLSGGASWSALAEGFANEISVTISPANFTLTNSSSQQLTVTVDLAQADMVGQWVYGKVRLTSSGLPDAIFPIAVYSSGGDLPDEWQIKSADISGYMDFVLYDLVAMPDPTFTSGGLVVPTLTVESLPQDPTDDSPYDSSTGVMTVWHSVPAGSLWLHTETLTSASADLDLFVGRDTNGDGKAQEVEELCSSISPTDIELCDLFEPVAGNYWVIVQNWEATNDTDEVILRSAVVGKDSSSPLSASGTGIAPMTETLQVRLSWENVSNIPGTELLGAVGIGTNHEKPNNIGIIPVIFTKTDDTPPERLIGGNISGLAGAGLVLQNNGGDDLPISVNGSFTFATALIDGTGYAVTVKTQPADPIQICSITNGSGTVAGVDVTNVSVTCVDEVIFSNGFE